MSKKIHHSSVKASLRWKVRSRREGYDHENEMWMDLARSITFEEMAVMWGVRPSTVYDRVNKSCPEALRAKPKHVAGKHKRVPREDRPDRYITITCKHCNEEYVWDTFHVRKMKYLRTYCDSPVCVALNTKEVNARYKQLHGPRPVEFHEVTTKLRDYGPGRKCKNDSCITILRRSNKGPLCDKCRGIPKGLLGTDSSEGFPVGRSINCGKKGRG